MTIDPGKLRVVRLLEFPLDVNQRATEAFEGMRREFTLVAMRTPEASDVPTRLLELITALTDEFEDVGAGPGREGDEALARGETVLAELVHRVPPSVVPAFVALNDMCDEADGYCRQGDVLLSMASPPEAIAFRRWFLGEFTAQVAGQEPLPWPDADQETLLCDARLRGTFAG